MNLITQPSYTQLPNSILDNLPLFKNAELRVLLCVCRNTFGYHKERKKMSLGYLATGTGMTKQGVLNAVGTLLERKLVGRLKSGDSFEYFCLVNPDPDQPKQEPGPTPEEGTLPLNGVDTPLSTALTCLVNGVDTPLVNGVDRIKKGEVKKPLKKEGEAPAQKLPPEALRWNEVCGHISRVLNVSGDRERHLAARRREPFWVESYESALCKIAASDFCGGKSDRAWVATFDWILQPGSLTKVMEGKYANRNGHRHEARPMHERFSLNG